MTILIEKIRKQIQDTLFWDTRIDSSDIEVIVTDSEVTLKGTVADQFSLKVAEEDALNIPGVNKIINLLKVDPRQETYISQDQEILKAVEQMLLWDPDIDSSNIQVSVSQGKVTLEGTTESYFIKQKCQNITENISGILHVSNRIIVIPIDLVSDEDIGHQILKTLDGYTDIQTEDINLTVENGTVTLSGHVKNHLQKREIINATIFIKGVTEIKDELKVNKHP